MPSLLTLAAPLALVMPFLGQGLLPGQAMGLMQQHSKTDVPAQPQGPSSSAPDFEQRADGPYSPMDQSVSSLDAFRGVQVARQVRIDQRVTIRITPRREGNRNSLLARLPQQGINTAYEERSMERCVPMAGISGVQTGTGNRLLLFLKDSRIVTVNLERACRARDFYSGFYIERSEDGNLCVDRDELQSRSGAKCEVEAMRQLVAVEP